MKLKTAVVGAPLAAAAGLLAQVRGAPGNVLVVGHSNTVPGVLKQLGVTPPESPIPGA